MYVLYDNVGKLTLKSLGNMKLNKMCIRDSCDSFTRPEKHTNPSYM